jgi:preprotein translocase subunit SecF
MKKVFSVMVALMMALSMIAAERGKLIHVDCSTSKNLKPQLAFCQETKDGQDVTTLLVKTVNVNQYNEFTDASRVLVRFADDKAFRLNKVAGSAVEKKKHTEKKGNATISFYDTYTSYEVSPEVIEKLEAGIAIIKVRIVFKENDSKDYDIVEGYQAKMAEDLLKSYQEAVLKNRKVNGDTADDDF